MMAIIVLIWQFITHNIFESPGKQEKMFDLLNVNVTQIRQNSSIIIKIFIKYL